MRVGAATFEIHHIPWWVRWKIWVEFSYNFDKKKKEEKFNKH
jgi:hypothetical protein